MSAVFGGAASQRQIQTTKKVDKTGEK